MKRMKRLLIVVLAIWLPLSVIGANAMTLAMFGKAGEATEQMAEGCEMHQQQAQTETSPADCHNCSLCHFACTALMSAATGVDSVASTWVPAEFVPASIRLVVPHPLQRPPLPRAA